VLRNYGWKGWIIGEGSESVADVRLRSNDWLGGRAVISKSWEDMLCSLGGQFE
jgi:hypothetical protein